MDSSGWDPYDLVTVNWNPRQTELWMFHVKRSCPGANVVLIDDGKPFPWCWSSGKLNCFADFPGLRNPGRFVYMDTDTIVTRDVGEVFELMGDAKLAASSAVPSNTMNAWARSEGERKNVDVAFELSRDHPPVHYSSGFMVLKDYPPADLGFKWSSAMAYEPLRATFGRHRCYEEIALSYVIAADRIPLWDMPLEIHGNLLGRHKCFGHTRTPMVIHYHNERRLKINNLERYIVR